MMAWAMTDLPDPDSPTRATLDPWPMRKDTPLTARTTPSSTWNSTSRSRTARRSVTGGSPWY